MTKGKRDITEKKSQDLVIIRKSNDLIEARYKMTMWEARVWDKFLSILRKEKEIQDEYRINISEIIANYQLFEDKRAFQRIVKAAHDLQDRYITNSTISREEFRHLRSHIFASVETVVTRQGDSYILFEVPKKIKPILTATNERYKDFALENFIGISSFYSKRIYELLKQYERIGERTFTVDDLRNILAIEEDEYKLYGHFKKRILDKAQEDLLRCTDICLDYEEIKRQGSKQVASIRFIIRTNAVQKALLAEKVRGTRNIVKRRSAAQMPLFTEMETFEKVEIIESAKEGRVEAENSLFTRFFDLVNDWWGVEEDEFRKRLFHKTEAEVSAAVAFTKERIKVGKAANPAGVFLDALSKGHKTKEQILIEKQTERARQERDKQERLIPLVSALDELEDKQTQDINDAIRLITSENSEVTQQVIDKIKRTYRQLGMTDIMDKTIEDFRQSPMLRSIVKSEIMSLHPAIFNPMKARFDQRKAQILQEIRGIEPQFK